MKKHLICAWIWMIVLESALAGQTVAQAATKEGPAKAMPRLPLNLSSLPDVPIPQSVFSIPSQSNDGRNPFFPQSTVRVLVPKVNQANPIETFAFVLNGITSPPRRTAMINGRTLEVGEEGEVRLPGGGKMLIKCLEIKAESAVIEVGGQRRELRLRSGL